MTQGFRGEEHEPGEQEQEHQDRERVLDGVVRMEGDRVLLGLHVHADRVVVARNVQRPDVQADDAGDHEGQQEVQGEEAVQGGIVHRETAPQPGGDRRADAGDHVVEGREQVGDHHRPVIAHLTPGQDVAHEGGGHHQEIDDAAQQPQDFPGGLVRAVIEAAGDVHVHGQEEHRSAVGVDVTDHPAVVHVAHDVLDAVEGEGPVGHVVHGQDHASDDLDDQTHRQDAAEGPPIVQVLRRGEVDGRIVGHAHDGKTDVEPTLEAGLGFVVRMSAHGSFAP